MAPESTPSGIFEWLTRNCRPKRSDSATLRFERMASQAGGRLPEIHLPLDHRDPSHWRHRGMIWDYVFSLDGCERVLDIGPGDGWPSLLLAPHFKEVVGIEPGPRRAEACRESARRMKTRKAHFEEMSADKMTFAKDSFDGVVAATSIEQTPDPVATLKEVHRVLKPGGILRMTYEAYEEVAEPVREAVSVKRGGQGSFLVDYVVCWTEKAEERGYLLEVVPLSDGSRKRLELWAVRCADDVCPHRDPRLERGLAQTIKAVRKAEVVKCHVFRLHHFKTRNLRRTLERIGFGEVRQIAGGGWVAEQCAREMIQSRRIEAAAPLMEEMCRAAARVGIGLETPRHGNVMARKMHRRSAPKTQPVARKKAR